MKRIILLLLAASVLLCGLTTLADQDASGDVASGQAQNADGDNTPEDDLSRFSIPRIQAPTIPEIEVPEVPEIEVPEVPTAAPTTKPKIEAPEIPAVDESQTDAPQVTAEAVPQVEAALAALGVDAYRALYDALSRGEAIGEGSRGEAAKGLQQMLVAFGQAIRVDGIVGPKTIDALNAVREQYELPQTDRLNAAGLAELLPLLLKTEADNLQ